MKSTPWSRSLRRTWIRGACFGASSGEGRAWLIRPTGRGGDSLRRESRRLRFPSRFYRGPLEVPLDLLLESGELLLDAARAGVLDDVLERRAPRIPERSRQLVRAVEEDDLRARELPALVADEEVRVGTRWGLLVRRDDRPGLDPDLAGR